MSPEALMVSSVPVPPSAVPAAGAVVGAASGPSGETSGTQGSSASADAPPAPQGGQTSDGASGAANQSAAPASPRSGPSGRPGSSGSAAGNTAGTARTASSAKPPAGSPAAGSEFSQALAQSLAAPARTGASDGAGASRARSGGKADPARSANPDKRTDPVAAAMALVTQAMPMAGAAAGTGGASPPQAGVSGKESATTAITLIAGGSGNGPSALAAGPADKTAALEAAVLAHPAPPAGGSAGPGSAAALAAVQLGATARAVAQTQLAGNAGTALSAPVGTSDWTRQLGSQLTWMSQQGIQSASLQLSPDHLGPLQVSISVHQGQASVWFGAAQPETREALSRAMPELRSMFANQGLALTDSGVSRDAPRDPRGQASAAPLASGIGDDAAAPVAATAISGIGLLDTYA